MLTRKMITVLALAVAALAACSSQKMTMLGSERTIEKSGDKPDWVYEIPKEDKEYFFFRGFKTSAVSLEDGLTDARANATRQVLEMIQSQGLIDYKKARVERGLASSREDIGSVTEDGLKILSQTVANGVKELETYTEKVERVTPEGLRYFFNVYTLVRYPKQEYDRAVALAASAKNTVQRAVNDAQAQKVIENLDKGLPTY